MSSPYSTSDIAIVTHGCVMPGALNSSQFWDNCLTEKTSINLISEERLKRYANNGAPKSKDKIQSYLACEIPVSDYHALLQKNNLKREEASRLYTYLHEALVQTMGSVKTNCPASRCDFIVGCMNPDADYEKQIIRLHEKQLVERVTNGAGADNSALKARIKDFVTEKIVDSYQDQNQMEKPFYSSEAMARLSKHFGLLGEHYLIDAACASSLVAVDMAVQRLRLGLSDFVVAGGVESNLGYGAYMAFSVVGALAVEYSVPFDKKSQGIVQGEGAVIFGLKRLSDALRDGDTIQAVIRGVAGSSDGRSASLFQPNVQGQSIVYQRVYQQERKLSYLEAHGTGTPVGDQTEMESITGFFKDQRFPVGSSKTLYGHSKATAGAAGMLKSLFIIKEKTVPPSSKIGQPVFTKTNAPYINTTIEHLPSDRLVRTGINAFGFGGTNYHVLLEEFDATKEIQPSRPIVPTEVVLVTEAEVAMDSFSVDNFLTHGFPFRLPPKTLSSTDEVQLAALLAAWNAIKPLGKIWHLIPREKVNVVSGCTLFLDKIIDWVDSFAYEILDTGTESDPARAEVMSLIGKYVEKEILPSYANLNEDSTPGILNNIIAGRVCNSFDLFGKSYNIDKDTASSALVLQNVMQELQNDPDQLFICLSVIEMPDESDQKTTRVAVEARLVTSIGFAKRHELPAISTLQSVMPGGRL